MKEVKNNIKVLLHACCAICSGYPVKFLRSLGYEPVVYFFNPNIYPAQEYFKRLDAQRKLCESLNCELIAEDYQPEIYNEAIKNFENYPEGSERCNRCFELRLSKSAQKAKELGINIFTTSLSISPHKNFKAIKSIGNFFSGFYKINFLDFDFKKQNGFLQTNEIARELGLYRQDYCGCDVSMRVKNDG